MFFHHLKTTPSENAFNWRHLTLLVIIAVLIIYQFSNGPIAQNQKYHLFVDARNFFSIPNFNDVISNLPFLAVGIYALMYFKNTLKTNVHISWSILFLGIALVSIGSTYYHLNPNDHTLVWDRLPMTIGFMGLFAALLGEYVDIRLSDILLIPLILAGLASVIIWQISGDLRFYFFIQILPLVSIPSVMVLFKKKYSHQWFLLAGLIFYLMAKFAELYDIEIFKFSNEILSGHTLKHLLAAAGCYSIFLMLKMRNPV